MKKIYLFMIVVLLSGLISGCASRAALQKTDPDAPPQRIVIYEEKVKDQDIEKGEAVYIRQEPLYIDFGVDFEPQLNRYVIDMGRWETQGFKWGEKVIWTCRDKRPFTVYFGWDSPFGQGVYPAREIEPGVYQTDEAIVRRRLPVDARAINYKYSIATYIEEEDLVVVHDPVILFVPPDYNYWGW